VKRQLGNRKNSYFNLLLQTLAPSGVLLLSLVLSAFAWYYVTEQVKQQTKIKFERQVSEAKDSLSFHIQTYINALQASESLFAASESVERDEWKKFIDSLNLQKLYPGINSIGFIRYGPQSKKADYEQQVRRDTSVDKNGYPNFRIKPAGIRPEYSVTEYIEPLQLNRTAFGLDIGFEPVRRAAVERARDTGEPAATGRIILVQDKTRQPGLLILLPVYRHDIPLSTVKERRSALVGFVYGSFRASSLIREALSNANKQDLNLLVYNSKALMYDSNNGVQQVNKSKFQLRQVVTLNVAGEAWQLYFTSNSSLDKTPSLVAYGGTIISLLLSGIVWSLASSQRRALLLATSMTAELRQSENQLRDFFDNANDLIQSVTPNAQFVFVNRAWRETLGYSEEEVKHLSLIDILHPDSRDHYLEVFKPVLAGEACYRVEAIFVTKDKRAITVEGSLNCQFEHGLPKLTRGIFRDITERKQTEKALQQAEEKYRSIFENAIEGIFQTTPDGRYLTANPMLARLYGYQSPEELIANISNIEQQIYVDPNRRAEFLHLLQKHDTVLKFESQVYRQDGSIIWISEQGRTVRDSNDVILYYEGTVENITERKQVEAALRESEERFKTFMNNSPVMAFIKDEQGRIIYINEPFERLFNVKLADLQGKTDFDWMPEATAKQVRENDLTVFATGKTIEVIETVPTPDGFPHYWLVLKFLVKEDSERRLLGGVAIDISDRKFAEEALQQANEKLTGWVNELKQRNHEITLLGEMSEVMLACFTVEEAYTALSHLLLPLFPDTSGGIFLVNASKNLLERVVTWGAASSQELFTPDDCWALRRGRVHSVEDSQSELRCKHIDHNSLPAHSLCIPMMAQGEAMGVLYLTQQAGNTQTKQQLAVTVAEHIALALANLKLRELLRHQSIRDPLTSLFNRRYMEESLAREIHRCERKHQPLGIIMLDVDHFKRFNDTFGHDAGDAVLRELGMFLQRHIRSSDIACRYGGEELMLILPETSLDIIQNRAEQIRQGVKHLQVQHDQQLGAITLSLGVACFPEHGLTGEAVIRAADAALYRAKKEGRDAVRLAS
jgi:diguanylate cyclase (GGDEF)-like protein/PAS domain S-box-containing protein